MLAWICVLTGASNPALSRSSRGGERHSLLGRRSPNRGADSTWALFVLDWGEAVPVIVVAACAVVLTLPVQLGDDRLVFGAVGLAPAGLTLLWSTAVALRDEYREL